MPDYGGRGPRRGTPLSELDPDLTDLSRRLIGCAIEVHKELGPGFPRAIYVKAVTDALEDEDITFELDKTYDVECAGDVVGQVSADICVGERFLATLMAEHLEIGSQERAELRARLRAADMELGLIVNFGERRLKDGLVRVLNPDKLNKSRDEHHDEHHDPDVDEFED